MVFHTVEYPERGGKDTCAHAYGHAPPHTGGREHRQAYTRTPTHAHTHAYTGRRTPAGGPKGGRGSLLSRTFRVVDQVVGSGGPAFLLVRAHEPMVWVGVSVGWFLHETSSPPGPGGLAYSPSHPFRFAPTHAPLVRP